jgi:thiamine-phosphate pyrophosphorylase
MISAARLYVVSPPRPASWVHTILGAGVGALQLRDKTADAAALLEVGRRWLRATRTHAVPLVIDDRPDVTHSLDADGVHLGQRDLPAADARAILGAHKVIGRSTHSREQIDDALRQCEAGHADYLAVGPVWSTPTVPAYDPVGLELLRYAARHSAGVPWFAIGGIDAANVAQVVDAGASRVVVVRAVTEAPDPANAVKELLEALL